MATYWRGELLAGGIKLGEQTAAYRTVFIEVATDEAQTVTIAKAGSATFSACSAAATKISTKYYKIVLTAADVDTRGLLSIRSTGATNVQEGFVMIGPKVRTGRDKRFEMSL